MWLLLYPNGSIKCNFSCPLGIHHVRLVPHSHLVNLYELNKNLWWKEKGQYRPIRIRYIHTMINSLYLGSESPIRSTYHISIGSRFLHWFLGFILCLYACVVCELDNDYSLVSAHQYHCITIGSSYLLHFLMYIKSNPTDWRWNFGIIFLEST